MYLTLLSALTFSISFFVPQYFWWAIFSSPLLLFCAIKKHKAVKKFLHRGLVWGLVVYGLHFIWLAHVLIVHSHMPFLLGLVAYAAIVAYSSACFALWMAGSIVWFRIGGCNLMQAVPSCTSLRDFFMGVAWFCWWGLYWFIVEYGMFRPLGFECGYPFTNPLIPLAQHAVGRKIIAVFFGLCCWGQGEVGWAVPSRTLPEELFLWASPKPSRACSPAPAKLVWVAPVVNRVCNTQAPWRDNPWCVGNKILHQLSAYKNNSKKQIFVAPESFFLFPLNKHLDLVQQWGNALPPGADMLLGGILEQSGRYYQAVFWLREGLIINFYVKKMLTPFVEKIPSIWKSVGGIRAAFLGQESEFSDAAAVGGVEFFDVSSTLRVIPRVCFEFFFSDLTGINESRSPTGQTAVFVFVNDSWFMPWFRVVLRSVATLRAMRLGLPVVFVGHFGCYGNDVGCTF